MRKKLRPGNGLGHLLLQAVSGMIHGRVIQSALIK
jgi:hypothetical protein